jgi:hypothetical protein
MSSDTPACEAAQAKHSMTLRWLNTWTYLLFSAGCLLVLFLAVAIALILVGRMPAGAVVAVGALIAGGTLPWVVQRQREAVADEKEALREVGTYCGTTVEAEALRDRTRLRLFGLRL